MRVLLVLISRLNNEKRDTIKVLRQQALERNPDEFYFHMINSKCEVRFGIVV